MRPDKPTRLTIIRLVLDLLSIIRKTQSVYLQIPRQQCLEQGIELASTQDDDDE